MLDPASFTTAGRPESLQVLQMIEGSAIGAAIQASLQGSNPSGPALSTSVNATPRLGLLSSSSSLAPLLSAHAPIAAASSAPAPLNRAAAAASAPPFKPVKRQRKVSAFARYHSGLFSYGRCLLTFANVFFFFFFRAQPMQESC